MDSPLLSRLSDWNPQLFRELKGRLKPRNLIVAIAVTVLLQLLLLGFFASMLPADATAYSSYCTTHNYCLADSDGNLLIDWPRWWLNLFQVMNGFLLLGATLPGAYLLVYDIYQEEKRGTLNFIRLSPQSSSSILLGKMLGVPALAYVAIALLLPLHVFAAQSAGVPLPLVLSLYVIGGAGCWFLYSLALLGGFLGKAQSKGFDQMEGSLALLVTLSMLVLFIPGYMIWNVQTTWYPFARYLFSDDLAYDRLTWFMLPLQRNIALAHAFTLITISIASGWIWMALTRRFHNPSSTLINKRQSYGLTLCSQIFILGFLWHTTLPSSDSANEDMFWFNLLQLCFYMLVGCLSLTLLLSNQRQALLDWARFRHMNTPTQRRHRLGDWRSLLNDLLWSEKSPMMLAIAVNLMIATGFILVWILAWPTPQPIGKAIAGLVLTLNMMALYGSIAQLMMLMKASNRASWTAAALFSVMILPLMVGAIAASEGKEVLGAILLLFSPFPAVSLVAPQGSAALSIVGLACLAQWSGIVLLNLRFISQMKQLGESTSKSLLTEAKS